MTVQTAASTSSVMLEGLAHAYRSGRDDRIRDRLVLTLSPLVSFVFSRETAAQDDAVLAGGFGALIGAIERWDPASDGAIEQFAWTELSRLAAGSLDGA